MALPPSDTTNDSFVREVDEEFRRAQLLGFWEKWGKLLLAAIGVALLGLVVYLYLDSHKASTAGKQGEALETALGDIGAGQAAKAAPELRKLAADGAPGYSAMARFNEADILLSTNDLKGAAARYSEIAGDTKLPQAFRDLALIQQTRVEFDTLKPEAVISRLQPLANADSPWYGNAGELIAMAYLKQGKRAEAGKMFASVAQSKGSVPEPIRQRVLDMAAIYGSGTAGQSEEKKAQ